MVLELVAIQAFQQGWEARSYWIMAASVFIFVVDIVSDCLGLPT